MRLGLAAGFINEKGNKIRDGDKYSLSIKNDVYKYIAKTTPNGIVLVPFDNESPIGAVHESKMHKYDFKKI